MPPRRLRCRLLSRCRSPASVAARSLADPLAPLSLRPPPSLPAQAQHPAAGLSRAVQRSQHGDAPSPPLRRESRRPRRRQNSGPGCCAGVVKHSGVYARPAKRWPGTHAGRHAHNPLAPGGRSGGVRPGTLAILCALHPASGRPTRWKHRSGIRALARGVALSQREARPTGAEKARCPPAGKRLAPACRWLNPSPRIAGARRAVRCNADFPPPGFPSCTTPFRQPPFLIESQQVGQPSWGGNSTVAFLGAADRRGSLSHAPAARHRPEGCTHHSAA